MSGKMEIAKRTVAPGWTEIRIVVARPDTPDYKAVGDEAALAIAHFVLSFASGLGSSRGAHAFADACRALYEQFREQATTRRSKAPHQH